MIYKTLIAIVILAVCRSKVVAPASLPHGAAHVHCEKLCNPHAGSYPQLAPVPIASRMIAYCQPIPTLARLCPLQATDDVSRKKEALNVLERIDGKLVSAAERPPYALAGTAPAETPLHSRLVRSVVRRTSSTQGVVTSVAAMGAT